MSKNIDTATDGVERYEKGDDIPDWITVTGGEAWVESDCYAYQDTDGVWHIRPENELGENEAIVRVEAVPTGSDVSITADPHAVYHASPYPDDAELFQLLVSEGVFRSNQIKNADIEQSGE